MVSGAGNLFVIAGACFIASLPVLYGAAKRYLLLQKIEDIPTSRIGSAAIGLSELKGKAQADKPLASPITGTECVFWRLDFFSAFKHNFDHVLDTQSDSLFSLKDSTGSIRVDPSGAASVISIVGLKQNLGQPFSLSDPFSARTGALKMNVSGGEGDMTRMNQYFGSISGFMGSGPFRHPQPQLDQPVLDYVNGLDQGARDRLSRFDDNYMMVVESYLPADSDLYVLGNVQASEKGRVVTKEGPYDLLFMSVSDEGALVGSIRKSLWSSLLIGLGCLGISLICILIIMYS